MLGPSQETSFHSNENIAPGMRTNGKTRSVTSVLMWTLWRSDVKCEGKAYKTRNVLTCPYHSLAYQIECEKRVQQAHDVIHRVLGRSHTTQNKAFHNVLICFRPKHSQITRFHYHMSTNLGLLQSNMTYMNRVHGMGYHCFTVWKQRSNRPMPRDFRCFSTAKLKQLKRRKSSGSLNTGVQTQKKTTKEVGTISKGSTFIWRRRQSFC